MERKFDGVIGKSVQLVAAVCEGSRVDYVLDFEKHDFQLLSGEDEYTQNFAQGRLHDPDQTFIESIHAWRMLFDEFPFYHFPAEVGVEFLVFGKLSPHAI